MIAKRLPISAATAIYIAILLGMAGYSYLLNQGHIEARNRALYETYRSYAIDLNLISTLLEGIGENSRNIGYTVLLLRQAHSTTRTGEILSEGGIWVKFQEAVESADYLQGVLSRIEAGNLQRADIAKINMLSMLYRNLAGIIFRNFPVDERLHRGSFTSIGISNQDSRDAIRMVHEIKELIRS